MKLGDMTIKQIAEYCAFHRCDQCQFCDHNGYCMLLNRVPSHQDLNMEVKTDEDD